MNLNIFTPIDLEKIGRLKFIEKTIPFIVREKQGVPAILGGAHLISTEAGQKLNNLLRGKEYNVKAGDKVYVFPRCKIPQFKIKEHLREQGAYFTSDYNAATVYLGTRGSCGEFGYSDETFNLLVAKPTQDLYYLVPHVNNVELTGDDGQPIYEELYKEANTTLVSRDIKFTEAGEATKIPFMRHILYPLGADIVFNILSKQIPVVNEDYFNKRISPAAVIDQDLYDSLDSMLLSEDAENHSLACQTIANSDIEGSYLYLYMLGIKHFETKIRFNRLKNVKLFIEQSKMAELVKKPLHQFIREFVQSENKGDLSKAIMQKLLTDEANKLSEELEFDTTESGMFNLVLVPKPEFKDLHDDLTFTYELDIPANEG